MSRKWLGLVLVLVWVTRSSAQDGNWVEYAGRQYNCDTLAAFTAALEDGSDAVIEFSLEPFMVTGDGSELTLGDYITATTLLGFIQDINAEITFAGLFGDIQTACDPDATVDSSAADEREGLFNVVVQGQINLRACAGTQCDIVGNTTNGQRLVVLAEEGDWYEVRLEDGTTAFIAARFTTRGADAVLVVDDFYDDENTGCQVFIRSKRGDSLVTVILDGKLRETVVVDVYRPNETIPLPVDAQLDKEFIDTGAPYIHQFYRWNTRWNTGMYRLEITLSDRTSLFEWEMATRGQYDIFVTCDG
jgi:hypothetical protein